MPADYKPRDGLKQKKTTPGYIWLLAGLGIGLFVAFLIYLDKQPISGIKFETAIKQELEELKSSKKTESKPDKIIEEKEPKYNFYTILQGMKVLIPESETQAPDVQKNKTHVNEHKKYVLQAGSFQNKNDAEKLKVKIAFLGIEADIQQVTVNNQIWHRVRTAPFTDKDKLFQNMKTLQRNNINAISMEIK